MIKKGVTLLLSVFVLTVAWGENHYAPGKKNSLRAPSVPSGDFRSLFLYLVSL